MKCHYFQLEEFVISESVSLAFRCFDFVICSFQWTGTKPIIVEGSGMKSIVCEKINRPVYLCIPLQGFNEELTQKGIDFQLDYNRFYC